MFGIDDAAAATLAVGGLGFLGQQMTNSANQANAQAQMDYQTQMSNTAYQRQVKDLEAAGLNPMLAYIKGGGASTPTGAMATYQSPVSGAVQAATSAKAPSEIRKTEAETSAAEASTDLTRKEIEVRDATIGKIRAEVKKIEEEIANLPVERRRLEEEVRRTKAAYINLAEQSALLAQQGQTEVEKRKVLQATAVKLTAEGLITKAEYQAMVDSNFLGVAAREVKVFSDVSSEWVDKFLPWKRGKSITHESESIVYDSEGRVAGRDRYRSTRPR